MNSPVRIAICTEKYAPSLGGVEEVSRLLAYGLTELGNKVFIVTNQGNGISSDQRIKIYRRPNLLAVLILMARSDRIVLQGLSLKYAIPALFFRSKVLVVKHILEAGMSGHKQKLFRILEKAFRLAAVSDYLVKQQSVSEVAQLPNPYDSSIFKLGINAENGGDFIFVGRLIREKGIEILMDAADILKLRGINPRITVVGEGPLSETVGKWSAAQGENVRFLGPLSGTALAQEMASHKACVIPSTWQEPFGIIALEARAVGCLIIATRVGGLPEAAGDDAILIPPNNAAKLADAMMSCDLLKGELPFDANRQSALDLHSPLFVAKRYCEILKMPFRDRSPNS